MNLEQNAYFLLAFALEFPLDTDFRFTRKFRQDEVPIYLCFQLPCMPMLQMPGVTCKAAADLVKIHFPAAVFLLKGFQSPLKPPLVACPQAAYHLACIGQIKMPKENDLR